MIYFLTGYVAFEEVLLKFLPVSDTVYSASRFFSEALIYIAFGKTVIVHLHRGRPFVKTALELPILGFYTAVLCSILFNRSPLLGSLYNIRPLARYIVLFYTVANSAHTAHQIRTLFRILLCVGGFQCVIGIVQWIGGPAAFDFFLPRETTLTIGGFTKEYRLLDLGREIGSIYGTLGDTVIYGVFMSLVLSVYLSRIRQMHFFQLLGAAFLFLCIARSYSRAATFAALLAGGTWFFFHYGPKKTLRLATAGTLLFGILLVAVNPFTLDYINPRKAKVGLVGNITGVFSGDYVRVAQKQRLGALIGNVPTVLVNKPIFGYGADQNSTIEKLNQSKRSFLLKVLSKNGFKDVYWVALLCFYGIFGLGCFALIFLELFRTALTLYNRSPAAALTRQTALLMLCLVTMTAFLLFFNRTLEFRGYGFYFWLCAGLMVGSDKSMPTYRPLRIIL